MPKSIEEGFNKFISNLQPLISEHQKAASHKNSVFRCMTNNWNCTRLFETGSFGNGTGVRHYSDTDYFAICPDDTFYTHSGNTLRKIKETLQGAFQATGGIEVKTPSVRIPFGRWASERLEVTPACYKGLLETPQGKHHGYYIPDYDGGWMVSSPYAHNAYVTTQNKRLKGGLKPLIQLVKAWKFYAQAPITSFYLELRVTKYAEQRESIIYDRDLRGVLKFLNDTQLANMQDPMKVSGYVRACKTETKKREALSKLNTAYSRAEKAFGASEADAFYWWQMLYINGRFPAR
jgi:hypothetical protein